MAENKNATAKVLEAIGLDSVPVADLDASEATVDRLVEQGVLKFRMRAGIRHVEITDKAIKALVNESTTDLGESEYGDKIASDRAKHMDLRAERIMVDGHSIAVRRNLAESPIWRLRKMLMSSGKPWFRDAHIAAAQKLRDDFERGALNPSITAPYNSVKVDGGNTGERLTEKQMDARRRTHEALNSAPPDCRDILWRVCCMQMDLGASEGVVGHPKRSGKLTLRIGLGAIAAFYGIEEEGEMRCSTSRI